MEIGGCFRWNSALLNGSRSFTGVCLCGPMLVELSANGSGIREQLTSFLAENALSSSAWRKVEERKSVEVVGGIFTVRRECNKTLAKTKLLLLASIFHCASPHFGYRRAKLGARYTDS